MWISLKLLRCRDTPLLALYGYLCSRPFWKTRMRIILIVCAFSQIHTHLVSRVLHFIVHSLILDYRWCPPPIHMDSGYDKGASSCCSFLLVNCTGQPKPIHPGDWAYMYGCPCVVQATLFLGQLNSIAPIVTMFFLVSYCVVNLACLALKVAAAPNFRCVLRLL